jgi:uncharacterized XkdX family phage protein
MNWFLIAQRDWSIYGDMARIKNFVVMGKITPEQYTQITGETYVGA